MTGLTQRQQMVKDSVWRAKEDFQVIDYRRTDTRGQWDKGVQIKKPFDPTYHLDFKQGQEFTITDKFTTYGPNYCDGTFVPVELVVGGVKKRGQLEYTTFWPHIELVTAGKIDTVWALYSPSKGFVRDCEGLNYTKGSWGKYEDHEVSADGIVWTQKYTQSKRKKRKQDATMMLLNHSGYYDDIDTSDVYYVFEPGGEKVIWPDDLMVQEIDKATKQMVSESSAKEYLDKSFRLRPLTLKYGSAARQVFKHMEENGTEIFETLLFFRDNDEDVYQDEPSEKIKGLKAEFKDQKLKRGTYVMKSTYNSVAFAFKSKSDAVMFRLQYQGDLTGQLVDAETLADVTA